MSRLSLYSLVLFAGVGAMAVACGSDDDSTPAGTAGKSAAGSSGKAGGAATAGKSSGGATGVAGESDMGEGGTLSEAGAGGAPDTLYDRLGGYDNIKVVIGQIVVAEVNDEDIASFFAPNALVPSHEPSVGQIIDCFSVLLSSAAGGPYTYPVKLADGFQCRSMVKAHEALHIGSDTFDNFVTIAAGVLKDDKVAAADIATIGAVLTGTKDDIVDPDAPASGPCTAPACDVPSAGAGGEGGGQ